MTAKFHVLSIDGPVLRLREHRRPRQHTKDKHGCILCKQKRVKVCDSLLTVAATNKDNSATCISRTVSDV